MKNTSLKIPLMFLLTLLLYGCGLAGKVVSQVSIFSATPPKPESRYQTYAKKTPEIAVVSMEERHQMFAEMRKKSQQSTLSPRQKAGIAESMVNKLLSQKNFNQNYDEATITAHSCIGEKVCDNFLAVAYYFGLGYEVKDTAVGLEFALKHNSVNSAISKDAPLTDRNECGASYFSGRLACYAEWIILHEQKQPKKYAKAMQHLMELNSLEQAGVKNLSLATYFDSHLIKYGYDSQNATKPADSATQQKQLKRRISLLNEYTDQLNPATIEIAEYYLQEKNFEKAILYYEFAAANHSSNAALALSKIYEQKNNRVQTIHWLMVAARYGEKAALERLQKLLVNQS